ncbi:hypothetical protein A9W98_15970 [Mycobacterium gordonae]|uniref:Uncharacterized protein n=1 Tax=Mycobacterium gordonae TaxID=1778 RepID=A0A1A6BIS4_MYCGO|nr:hypothetical protein A9W98_15970 [Mycobacterium gordonae]
MIAALGLVGVAAQPLTEPLDVGVCVLVGGVIAECLVSVHRGSKALHHCLELTAKCASGVAVFEDFEQALALIVRTQKQARQGVHGGQCQTRIGIVEMRARNLHDTHRHTGIAGR